MKFFITIKNKIVKFIELKTYLILTAKMNK